MRWSIEELLYTFRLYREATLPLKIKYFPLNTWKKFKAFMFWLAYGYTVESVMHLQEYLTETIIFRLNEFRALNKSKFPAHLGSLREWDLTLDEMIEYFDNMRDEKFINIPEEKLIPTYIDLGNDQYRIEFNFTPEEQEEYQRMFDFQRKNDLKALEMFLNYYDHLWDF